MGEGIARRLIKQKKVNKGLPLEPALKKEKLLKRQLLIIPDGLLAISFLNYKLIIPSTGLTRWREKQIFLEKWYGIPMMHSSLNILSVSLFFHVLSTRHRDFKLNQLLMHNLYTPVERRNGVSLLSNCCWKLNITLYFDFHLSTVTKPDENWSYKALLHEVIFFWKPATYRKCQEKSRVLNTPPYNF